VKRAALLFLGLAACGGEAASGPGAATPTSNAAALSPVRAYFVELGEATIQTTSACDVHFVAVATGDASIGQDKLGPGDVAVLDGVANVVVRGTGVALVASYSPATCAHPLRPSSHVVLASVAPELTFAKGEMHAHLDVESEGSVYFGRLEGTAPVAEHKHDGTWEILCAVRASGTFTLAGKPEHVGDGQVVVVPPDTKHSWKPDAGSNLVAFQLYTPPGPEQRFKKLAAGGK
jgi:quercetin dioxygenase-like cupin family protein